MACFGWHGLDKITSSVNSNQEAVKVRMKPWELVDVKWLANELSLTAPNVRKIVRTPIFRQLGSNARATKSLLDAVGTFGDYWEDAALIDAVVKDVAFRYIKQTT